MSKKAGAKKGNAKHIRYLEGEILRNQVEKKKNMRKVWLWLAITVIVVAACFAYYRLVPGSNIILVCVVGAVLAGVSCSRLMNWITLARDNRDNIKEIMAEVSQFED